MGKIVESEEKVFQEVSLGRKVKLFDFGRREVINQSRTNSISGKNWSSQKNLSPVSRFLAELSNATKIQRGKFLKKL